MSNTAPANYWWWFGSDSAAAASAGMRDFLVPLLALSVSVSAAQAGMVSTIQLLLTQALLIPGGLVIDRFGRRGLVTVNASVNAIVLLVLSALALTGNLTLPVLIGAAIILGVCTELFGEASDALLRSIVTQESYPKAITVNEGRDAALRLAAAPAGSALMGIASGLGLLISGVLSAIAGVLITRVRGISGPQSQNATTVRSQVSEAYTWLKGTRRAGLLALLVGSVNFSVAGVMTTTQFAIFLRTREALDVGIITMSAGISVIVGAVLAQAVLDRVPTGILIPALFAWLGAGMTILAFFHTGVALVVVLMATFLGVPSLNGAMSGFFFSSTPEELQGRVQAILASFTLGLGALAPAAAGFVLQHWGTGWAYAMALTPMVIALTVALMSTRIRELPTPENWYQYEL
ncbi:MFS transporter [Brevibacterium gallinarum]|uniref:MFS transporter n=1 Tax=Brevibacterium gallinarum TaxID=2762220 RepID=A0ABR8WTZ0_9MICO|nr:MFS transporter [Brevibacterium gallinarum]MBD8020136.1 MFS transporter [Brevibacterium gallinarum]